MEIILLQTVKNLGRRGEVVEVKPGYARGFLLPQGMAVRTSKANLDPDKVAAKAAPGLQTVLGFLKSSADEVRDVYSDPTHRELSWKEFQQLATSSLWEAVEGRKDDPYRQQLADVLEAAVSRLEAFQLNKKHLFAIQATLARLSADHVTEQDVDNCENLWRGAEVETIPCLREAFEEWLMASESAPG